MKYKIDMCIDFTGDSICNNDRFKKIVELELFNNLIRILSTDLLVFNKEELRQDIRKNLDCTIKDFNNYQEVYLKIRALLEEYGGFDGEKYKYKTLFNRPDPPEIDPKWNSIEAIKKNLIYKPYQPLVKGIDSSQISSPEKCCGGGGGGACCDSEDDCEEDITSVEKITIIDKDEGKGEGKKIRKIKGFFKRKKR